MTGSHSLSCAYPTFQSHWVGGPPANTGTRVSKVQVPVYERTWASSDRKSLCSKFELACVFVFEFIFCVRIWFIVAWLSVVKTLPVFSVFSRKAWKKKHTCCSQLNSFLCVLNSWEIVYAEKFQDSQVHFRV